MATLTEVRTAKNRYLPDIRHKGWKLGQGGCSTTVERYYEMGTNKMFAVKKMPKDFRTKYDDLLQREFVALRLAAKCEVPRVINCFDPAWCPASPDVDCLLLELVEGSNLSKHLPTEPQTSPAQEPWMLHIAAQLVDTLWRLHCGSNFCHLDLSPDNIMLRSDNSNPWDTLRLIDFGFAANFNAGPEKEECHLDVSIKDVKPPGATAPYASPEVLRSLQLQFEQAEDDVEGVMVNGCLADMWALACILYEMLTGEKPFMPSEEQVNSAREAPATVPKSLRPQWQLYDVFAEAQRSWLESVEDAEEVGGVLKFGHPLLDRVADCSTRPTVAIEFFSHMFWPLAENRLAEFALGHPYIDKIARKLAASAAMEGASTSEGVQQSESTGDQASSQEASQRSQHAQQEVDGYESQSDNESNYESESGAETEYASACESILADSGSETEYDSAYESSEAESETESYAEDELMRVLSSSAPAAIRMELNIRAEVHSVSTGRAAPSPLPSISPVSSQGESIEEARHAQQGDEDAPSQGPSDVQLSFDSADAMAGEAAVSVGQASGVSSSDSEVPSIGQSAECQQDSAQQAPAVATAEHSQQSCLSSLTPMLKDTKTESRVSSESAGAAGAAAAGEAAASEASPPDSKPLSSATRKPVQKLKKLLSGKLRPSCMRAARTRTDSHQQELSGLKDKSRKSQKVSKQVQLIATPADVSTTSEQQQEQQQPGSNMAAGNKQGLGKLSGFFKPKKAASKSAGGGALSPQSVQETEPGDLIPAVAQPYGVVQQADPPALIATSEQAAKSTCQAHTSVKQKLKRLFCLSGQ